MAQLIVSPLSQLHSQLLAHRPQRVITLTSDAVAELPEDMQVERLVLRFHDIVAERDGLTMPDAGHIEKLMDFVCDWDRRRPLLIHCYAGVSRSPAAAFIAQMALDPAMNAQSAAQQLRLVSPSATPNARLIALADAALGRQGAMIGAVRSIGRGADAYEGEVFSLSVPD